MKALFLKERPLELHDQAALRTRVLVTRGSAGGVLENTICAEKEEGKNKGAADGGRSLSERNGHDDAVVALSEIESRRRGSGVGPVARSGRVRPPSPKKMKTPTTCLCAVERGTSFKMTVLSLSPLINQSLALFCGGGSLSTRVLD